MAADTMRIHRRSLLAVSAAVGLAGCGAYPKDPGRTLQRVRHEGPAAPWTVVGEAELRGAAPLAEAEGVPLAGIEVGLAVAFADDLDVRVQWRVDGESGLVERVEMGTLDLVIAGLTSDTQWSSRIGITRGYAQVVDSGGRKRKRVMGVPAGENAWVSALERFLDSLPAGQKGGS